MRDEADGRWVQFRVLYRVFLLRVVDLELLSTSADPARLVGRFATIFGSISLLFALPVMLMGGGRMPRESSWTTEHFFIATTITALGVLSVLNWDAAFPDRRDLLVLGPLPVRASTLFLAKVSALLAAPALAVVGLNVFSGLAWPMVLATGTEGALGGLRVWPAYWTTMAMAGLFTVCCVLGLQGFAANILPRRWFLRVSALLQAGVLGVFVLVYFLEPSLETVQALKDPGNQRALEWLPAYWFLGVFQQLKGSMDPAFAALARRAWVGLAVAVAVAGLAVLLGYFRMLPRIVEEPEILPQASPVSWTAGFGGGLKDAITLFSVRSLLRNRQHRTLLSFGLGVGCAVLAGSLHMPIRQQGMVRGEGGSAALIASLILMVLAVSGVRFLASIPVLLKANWIFQVTEVRSHLEYLRAVRVAWLISAVGPVGVIAAVALLVTASWRTAIWDLGVVLLVGYVLVELCLQEFAKVPFTCSYLPGDARIPFVFWVTLLLFFAIVDEGPAIESWMVGHPLRRAIGIGVLALAAGGLRWLTKARAAVGREIIFEEETQAELVTLGLK